MVVQPQSRVLHTSDLWFIWLCAAVPAIVFWLTTPWGIGLSVDSVQYLEMAETLRDESPLYNLGTHFPPLYPFLINLIGGFSDTLTEAARVLQFFVLYLIAGLAGTLVYKLSGGSRIAGLLIILAITFRWDLFFLWHFAWSEPVFVALLLGHYLLILKWINSKKAMDLVFAGLILGLTCLTRYAGAPFAGVSIIFVLIISLSRNSDDVVRKVGQFLAGFFLPLISWGGIALVFGAAGASRKFGFKGLPSDKLLEGMQVIGFWFGHGHGPAVGAFIAGFISFSCFNYFRYADKNARIVTAMFLLSVVGYIGFIIFSLIFIDAHIELHSRILFPSLILLMLVIGITIGNQVMHGKVLTQIGGILVLLFFATGSLLPMYAKAMSRITYGEGFANAHLKNLDVWKNKERYLQNKIVSNSPELIKIHMEAKASLAPRKYNAVTGEATHDFDEQMQHLKLSVLNGETTFIYFSVLAWRDYLPSERDILNLMQRQPEFSDDNVIVFHFENSKE